MKARLLERWVANLSQRFFFEVSEEIFHRSIIPTITASGYGGDIGILPDKDKMRF